MQSTEVSYLYFEKLFVFFKYTLARLLHGCSIACVGRRPRSVVNTHMRRFNTSVHQTFKTTS